jgi:hypothetical protein
MLAPRARARSGEPLGVTRFRRGARRRGVTRASRRWARPPVAPVGMNRRVEPAPGDGSSPQGGVRSARSSMLEKSFVPVVGAAFRGWHIPQNSPIDGAPFTAIRRYR